MSSLAHSKISVVISHHHDYYYYHYQKMLASWEKSYDQPRQHIKKLRHYFANKGSSSQGYGFSSSHVWM